METNRPARVTLSDLLDRVLDKGLVLDADLLITMGGVPLVGVKLRAAIAGMETMLRYGMFTAWEKQARRAVAGGQKVEE